MAKVSMKSLLESGVHFGHRTHRWDPRMKPYIFTERNGIHIIDLQQTVKALESAYQLIRDKVAEGGTILLVGTKRQAVETIQDEAERCGMPYVTVRWLGGMLTNWVTMRQRINELDRLERMREKGEFERLTKKEGLMLSRKIDKLTARFGGIRNMHQLPDMIFIVDVRREETAVREANTLGIPIVALVDTNCNPNEIDHVIPSNDDAIRTIKLMVGNIADAVLEGKAMRKEEDVEEVPAAAEAVEEVELSDDDLLGASTLRKMEEAAEEADEETVEEAVEETAEDTGEEAAEAAEETTEEPAEEASEDEADEEKADKKDEE
jgi:small subunit ribosomal protein S2